MIEKTMMIWAQDNDVDGGGRSAFAARDQMRPLNISVETANLAHLRTNKKIGIVYLLGVRSGLCRSGIGATVDVVAVVTAKLATTLIRAAANVITAAIPSALRFFRKDGFRKASALNRAELLLRVVRLDLKGCVALRTRAVPVLVSRLVSKPLPIAWLATKHLPRTACKFGPAFHAWSRRSKVYLSNMLKAAVPPQKQGIASLYLFAASTSAKRQRLINYGFDGRPKSSWHSPYMDRPWLSSKDTNMDINRSVS